MPEPSSSARDDEPKVPQSAREWHELALGRCTCPDDQDEARNVRGTVAERLRLRLANALNRLVFFPLANAGEAADRIGGRVVEWAERQR